MLAQVFDLDHASKLQITCSVILRLSGDFSYTRRAVRSYYISFLC